MAVIVWVFFGALPVGACTISGQNSLLNGLDQGDWIGVYEQETIARAPSVLIRGAASASVVIRYWGEPPANLGLQLEGGGPFPFLGFLGGDSCNGLLDSKGNILYNDGRIGTVGYGAAYAPAPEVGPNNSPEEQASAGTVPWHRSAPSLILETGGVAGPLSDNELAALEAAYGAPHAVEVSPDMRIQARVAAWAPTVIALVLFVGSMWLAIRMVRRGRGHRAGL